MTSGLVVMIKVTLNLYSVTPSRNECWCVDKFGNVEPGSRRISQKPQCGYNHANTLQGKITKGS